MTWIDLEIPPGSALEADIQTLRLRIKQVVTCYCIILFATVIWITLFSDNVFNRRNYFNKVDTLYNLCSPTNIFPVIPTEASTCERTFTFYFGDDGVGGSIISDLTQYARAAAIARRMNYMILIDDSLWKYGQLSYYFDAQVDECNDNTDHPNSTNHHHKVKLGDEEWESKAHIFADNTVDLDNVFVKGSRSFDQPSMEGKTIIFDNHWNRKAPTLPVLPVVGWWSDRTVFEEIKRIWNPNGKIRHQVIQMVRKMKMKNKIENSKLSQRLSFANIGWSNNFKRLNITALLPYSPDIDNSNDNEEKVERFSSSTGSSKSKTSMKTATTTTRKLLESSFLSALKKSLYEKEPSSSSSILVILFCDDTNNKEFIRNLEKSVSKNENLITFPYNHHHYQQQQQQQQKQQQKEQEQKEQEQKEQEFYLKKSEIITTAPKTIIHNDHHHQSNNNNRFKKSLLYSQPQIDQLSSSSDIIIIMMMMIRDLIFAQELSNQIVCHTSDIKCRFLILSSSFH